LSATLFVVATPIGNLGDISKRAADTLSAVTRIAAEDTRRTRALLSHLGIQGKLLVSLDANATESAVAAFVDVAVQGEDVAFVTDAGTPSVSDPGTRVVRAAAARGARIVVIPGPSAVTAAVALSGLVEGPFTFLGFLPRKGDKRKRAIRRIATSSEPTVLFEAPSRIRETLAELSGAMPERQACVARELTKMHEEARRGSLAELSEGDIPELGEITVVVAGAPELPGDDALDVAALIDARLAAGDAPRTVADELSALTDLPRREVYARVLAARRRRDEC
jgi:16S rRNA (cytidine1402-2'-O)-methyltransferase